MSRRLPVPRFVGVSVTTSAPIADGLSSRPTQELLRPDHYLEIGLTPDGREIVVNFPGDAYTPQHHMIFSADQARGMARMLLRKADECLPTERARRLPDHGKPRKPIKS